MVVAVDTGDSFRASPPERLFLAGYEQPNPNAATPTYDVAQDGRFLMMKTDDGQASAQLILVQNWTQELLERVPVP